MAAFCRVKKYKCRKKKRGKSNKINIEFNIRRTPNSLESVQVTFDGVGGGESTIQETGGAY